jgi:hypothetical protein
MWPRGTVSSSQLHAQRSNLRRRPSLIRVSLFMNSCESKQFYSNVYSTWIYVNINMIYFASNDSIYSEFIRICTNLFWIYLKSCTLPDCRTLLHCRTAAHSRAHCLTATAHCHAHCRAYCRTAGHSRALCRTMPHNAALPHNAPHTAWSQMPHAAHRMLHTAHSRTPQFI